MSTLNMLLRRGTKMMSEVAKEKKDAASRVRSVSACLKRHTRHMLGKKKEKETGSYLSVFVLLY